MARDSAGEPHVLRSPGAAHGSEKGGEIGVRAGYGAAAFLAACPQASYHGVDAENRQHGGLPGAVGWARTMLARHFPGRAIRIDAPLDTRQQTPDGSGYDLAHVDGDHSFAGCLHDLELVERLGCPWILVDDIDYLPPVRHAVELFLGRTGYRHVYLPSFRGDCLIRTRAGEALGPAPAVLADHPFQGTARSVSVRWGRHSCLPSSRADRNVCPTELRHWPTTRSAVRWEQAPRNGKRVSHFLGGQPSLYSSSSFVASACPHTSEFYAKWRFGPNCEGACRYLTRNCGARATLHIIPGEFSTQWQFAENSRRLPSPRPGS